MSSIISNKIICFFTSFTNCFIRTFCTILKTRIIYIIVFKISNWHIDIFARRIFIINIISYKIITFCTFNAFFIFKTLATINRAFTFHLIHFKSKWSFITIKFRMLLTCFYFIIISKTRIFSNWTVFYTIKYIIAHNSSSTY